MPKDLRCAEVSSRDNAIPLEGSHMRISLPLLALLGCASTVAAQQPLTLQDAIAMAQKQGPSAQIARSIRDAARSAQRRVQRRSAPAGDAHRQTRRISTHGINPITLNDGSTHSVLSRRRTTSTLGLFVAQKIPLTGGTLAVRIRRRAASICSAIRRCGQYSTTPFVVALQQDLFKPRNLVWDEKVQSLGAIVAERAIPRGARRRRGQHRGCVLRPLRRGDVAQERDRPTSRSTTRSTR